METIAIRRPEIGHLSGVVDLRIMIPLRVLEEIVSRDVV
jgi:hypothetical protein